MSAEQTAQWEYFEHELTSTTSYANPYRDAVVTVAITSPSGRQLTRDAFWDGGDTWRFRLQASELGTWQWQTSCTNHADRGLHGQQGSFVCGPNSGEDAFAQHGALRLAPDQRSFTHADGTPFFWLGDTCWNGVLRATAAEWDEYLVTRRAQGFNIIQFIATNWRALSADPFGEQAFLANDPEQINTAFFQRLDPKVAAINAHGMAAAPILIHDNGAGNMGGSLSEADAIRLARYLVARWGAHQIAFTLGGDGRYDGATMQRWQNIGRGVFSDQPGWPVTMHAEGEAWLGPQLASEPWLTFIGYQSGHGDLPSTFRWLTVGPPSQEWRREPVRPLINVELNYERHPAFQSRRPFTDHGVRRAVYWSLLVAPTAGVTYGHQWIWPWNSAPEEPEGHDDLAYGVIPPWREAIAAPGAQQMTVMRALFDTLPWWELRPAQELVRVQPGDAEPTAFVAAAQTGDGRLALVYTPLGGELHLDLTALRGALLARWFDPRSGAWTVIGKLAAEPVTLDAPDGQDWLLVIETT